MSKKDRVIEEVHAAREAIAKDAGYDLDRIMENARARQEKSGRCVVQRPPKKPSAGKKAF